MADTSFWPDTQIIRTSKWLRAPLSSTEDLEAERRFQTLSCFHSFKDIKFKESKGKSTAITYTGWKMKSTCHSTAIATLAVFIRDKGLILILFGMTQPEISWVLILEPGSNSFFFFFYNTSLTSEIDLCIAQVSCRSFGQRPLIDKVLLDSQPLHYYFFVWKWRQVKKDFVDLIVS